MTDEEEDSLGSLPDDILMAIITEGEFSAEESCDAVEELLRRGLECPEAVVLMRDVLFGFESSSLRYRAAISLSRLKSWDDDVHRALCQAVSKLGVEDPSARAARLQLQRRGLSAAIPPERPRVGSVGEHAQPVLTREPRTQQTRAAEEMIASDPQPSAIPTSAPATKAAARDPRPATPLSNPTLPRYTMESVDEPRLHYRRRKRKRGELLRQVISNVQMLVIFFAALIGMLLLMGRC
jgi:hypothetical protein